MKIHELNHVAIHVKDVEKSCDFYRTVLQLEPMDRPAFPFPGAWFRLGTEQELHLIGERTDPIYAGPRKNHYALRVDDIVPWEQHFKALGIDFYPRRTRPDGVYQIYVVDPDGHAIELCAAPTESEA